MLLLIAGIISFSSRAQNAEMDSLLSDLANAKPDTNKVMLYFETGASIIFLPAPWNITQDWKGIIQDFQCQTH